MVEWRCLERIMLKLGFTERWVALVMQCINTITYAIRINGVPQGDITPSRGLCQGNLLSPYLSLLCAEGLLAMLHQAVQNKRLRGISACRCGPKISHLFFFANDSLIFGRATVKESSKSWEYLRCIRSHRVNNWTSKTPLFISTTTQLLRLRKQSKHCLVHRWSSNMKHTEISHPLLANLRPTLLLNLRRRWQKSRLGEKRTCSRLLDKKSLLRSWPRLCQHTQWVVLNSPMPSVMISPVWLVNFGEDRKMRRRKWCEWGRRNCVFPRRKGEYGLEI